MPITPQINTGSAAHAPPYQPTEREIAEIARAANPEAWDEYVRLYGSNQQLFDANWKQFSQGQYKAQQKSIPTQPGWPDKVVNTNPQWIAASIPFEKQYLEGLREQGWNVDPNLATGTGNTVSLGRDFTQAETLTRPGVTIDQAAYADTAQEGVDQNNARDFAAELQARDANRNAINPALIPQVNAAQADTRFTDTSGAFFETQRDLRNAENTTRDILANKQGMQQATGLARDAALGLAPSEAEQMFLNAGAEGKSAYERIAMQAEIDSRNRINQLRQSQYSLAAGQRGAVSGLANLQAMNNTAMGQAQIAQATLDTQRQANFEAVQAQRDAQYRAAGARANEMASSRELYFQAEQAMRAGDIEAARQLTALAQTQFAAENAQLGVEAANTEAYNSTSQFNANQANTVGMQNASNQISVRQGNQNAAIATGQSDTAAALDAQGEVMSANEADKRARVQLESDYANQVGGNADREANLSLGIMSHNQDARNQQRALDLQQQDSENRHTAALISGGATIVGAAATAASDERMKNNRRPAGVPDFRDASMLPQDSGQLANSLATKQLNSATGSSAPPIPSTDFRRARDERYNYKGDPTRTQYTGPMAQQLPTNVQTPGPNGRRYVDTGRLAMNLASAVGDLQRKVGV